MSFTRRLLLVGSDHRFAQFVQTHFQKSFLLTVPLVRADVVPHLVSRDTDGVLLFLASDPGDVERIESSVRELRIQLLPPKLAVLESEGFADSRRLDPVSPHVAARFTWPAQLRELNAWTRRAVVPGEAFVDPATETVAERIRRLLLTPAPSLDSVVEQVAVAAAHDVPVLLEGEPGTGKTHLARLIHECSERAANRFVAVSCGSLGAAFAGELFGHVKGASAGADTDKAGKLTLAAGGTLLLDEVDALGPEQQSQLLQLIESGEFEPVGGSGPQACRARILAASNSNLAEAVERGTFRRDLYYRLNVVSISVPPLRARPQDVGPLARALTARYAVRFGKRLFAIAPDAVRALEQYTWPANIRQLENVMQQAVLLTTDDTLTADQLPPAVQARTPGRPTELFYVHTNSLVQNRESTERAVIVRALEKVGHSRTRAAELLGVSRVTLYKKMKKYGLLTQPAAAATRSGG